MRKIYDSNNTQNALRSVFPNHFKLVNDKSSNGYKFFNVLYGIELDSIRDYLDQSVHYTSFENFDFGLDFDFSYIKFAQQINSGYIYGDSIPIKITNNEEFLDGKPTRFVHDIDRSINLSGYVLASGVNGVEYMRVDRTGSGILYINTDIDSSAAITLSGYQTFKLPLTDLSIPRFDLISGVNFGVDYQSYDSKNKYELLNPELEETLKFKYAFTKKVSFPADGKSENSLRTYTVDYYNPEQYYWDTRLNTYKPILPTRDKYLENDKEVYYRQALNNPNGTGVYNTVYLDLEFVPIEGTLKLYDIDTLTDQLPTEINRTGTPVYKYNAYNSGDYSPYYTYIGYSVYVPVEEGLLYPASGTYYKTTSWDYVHEGDGLVNFDWVTHPSNPITNKIKIVNPIGRYIVEYTYVVDKYHNAITTSTANRYVKFYNENFLFSSLNINNNAAIISNSLSVEKDTRRAITFDGFEVRPGSIINEMFLRGILTKEVEIFSSSSINVTNTPVPGYRTNILPNILDHNIYDLNHNYSNIVFNPVNSTVKNIYIDTNLGKRLSNYNSGIYNSIYYDFYNENLTANKILRIRFRPNVRNSNYMIMSSTDSDTTGWKISYLNNYNIEIQDNISTIVSIDPIILNSNYQPTENDIIDIILVANGSINYSISSLRYDLFVSINNEFFKKIELIEANSTYYVGDPITKTLLFPGVNVDLDYVKIYNEVTINGDNIL